MAQNQSLRRGTLVLTASNIALRGSGMVFQIYLTHILAPAGMGLLQLILTVHLLAMTLGTWGVRVAVMFLTGQTQGNKKDQGTALGHCLAMVALVSLVVAVILFFLTPWVAAHWIGDGAATSALAISAVFLPASCLWSVMAGYFTASGRLTQLVQVEFLDQALSIGATIWILTHWAQGDTGRCCSAVLLGNGISTTLTLLVLLLLVRPLFTQNKDIQKKLLSIAVPVGINDSLRSGLSSVEQAIIPRGLTAHSGSSDVAMATYGTIMAMVFPIMMFPGVVLYSLSDLLVPRLASLGDRRSPAVLSLCQKSLEKAIIFAFAVSGICWSLGGNLGILLYKTQEAGQYLRIFAPFVVMLDLDAMIDGIHKGLGEQAYCVRVNTLTNVLDVLFLWFLLPPLGIGGYIITFILTHALNFILSLRRLIVVTGYAIPWRFLGKSTLVALTATALTTFLWNDLGNPLLSVLLGLPTFLLTYWSLGNF